MAGIPRASLVVIAATLSHFQIPETGLLLLLGIDHFLDMGRSATNVLGTAIATAIIARLENELSDPSTSISSSEISSPQVQREPISDDPDIEISV